jgi:hypothetical protein
MPETSNRQQPTLPKRRLSFFRMHGVVSQKIELIKFLCCNSRFSGAGAERSKA